MASVTAIDGANIADLVYSDLKKGDYDKTTKATVLDFYTDPSTDLQMALLQVGTTYVVAFRGTTSAGDVGTDLQMGVSTITSTLADQFVSASTTLSMWETLYGLSTNNTTIVGHSLGGSLAQYFGAETGFETLTYNAYGVGNMSQAGGNSSNIGRGYSQVNNALHVRQINQMREVA